jgi:hypothetical protein
LVQFAEARHGVAHSLLGLQATCGVHRPRRRVVLTSTYEGFGNVDRRSDGVRHAGSRDAIVLARSKSSSTSNGLLVDGSASAVTAAIALGDDRFGRAWWRASGTAFSIRGAGRRGALRRFEM